MQISYCYFDDLIINCLADKSCIEAESFREALDDALQGRIVDNEIMDDFELWSFKFQYALDPVKAMEIRSTVKNKESVH